jgi:hypothetical protein
MVYSFPAAMRLSWTGLLPRKQLLDLAGRAAVDDVQVAGEVRAIAEAHPVVPVKNQPRVHQFPNTVFQALTVISMRCSVGAGDCCVWRYARRPPVSANTSTSQGRMAIGRAPICGSAGCPQPRGNPGCPWGWPRTQTGPAAGRPAPSDPPSSMIKSREYMARILAIWLSSIGLALAISVSVAGRSRRIRGRSLAHALQRVDQAVDLLHGLAREDHEQPLDAGWIAAESEHISRRHGVDAPLCTRLSPSAISGDGNIAFHVAAGSFGG